jgi:hypothetical protein
MTLTMLEAEDDRSEQSVEEYLDSGSARAGSRSSIGNQTLLAGTGTDLVRARMPAPQERPTGDLPIVDSPRARLFFPSFQKPMSRFAIRCRR